MIDELREHLEKNKENLIGSWINNNSSYDGHICKILGMEEDTGRYWDAIWKGKAISGGKLCIEFKKGNSIWLDLVRYSETYLGINRDASIDTFTLFFIPDKKRIKIDEIIGVRTKKIIELIHLTEDISNNLISLKETVPRSLNAQASLTKNDLKRVSEFVI